MKRRLPSLAGAPLLWLAHFLAVYALASLVCALPQAWPLPATAATVAGVGLLTLAALALGTAGLLRNRARLRSTGSGEANFFLAQANLLLYGLAIVGVLWVALPALMLPACA